MALKLSFETEEVKRLQDRFRAKIAEKKRLEAKTKAISQMRKLNETLAYFLLILLLATVFMHSMNNIGNDSEITTDIGIETRQPLIAEREIIV